jgi:hypothetical protein
MQLFHAAAILLGLVATGCGESSSSNEHSKTRKFVSVDIERNNTSCRINRADPIPCTLVSSHLRQLQLNSGGFSSVFVSNGLAGC